MAAKKESSIMMELSGFTAVCNVPASGSQTQKVAFGGSP